MLWEEPCVVNVMWKVFEQRVDVRRLLAHGHCDAFCSRTDELWSFGSSKCSVVAALFTFTCNCLARLHSIQTNGSVIDTCFADNLGFKFVAGLNLLKSPFV